MFSCSKQFATFLAIWSGKYSSIILVVRKHIKLCLAESIPRNMDVKIIWLCIIFDRCLCSNICKPTVYLAQEVVLSTFKLDNTLLFQSYFLFSRERKYLLLHKWGHLKCELNATFIYSTETQNALGWNMHNFTEFMTEKFNVCNCEVLILWV